MEPNDFATLFDSDGDNCMKSKPKILNFSYNTSENTLGVGENKKQAVKSERLTTKNAVKYLLEGQLRKKVCRYCLNVASPLSELDQVLQVAGSGKLFKVTIRDMVASFYPYKVADDPNFPNKICNQCLNQTIRSYLFTQQCERSERALRNCFDDIYSKFEKLDPLEPQKKRGRQKINLNHNVLYANYERVINYAEPIINIVNIGSELTEQVNIKSKFECLKCWQILPSMESLLNHEKQHPKSMWYNCRYCGKSFTKRNLLKKHVWTAHESGKQLQLPKTDFKCTDCGVVSERYNEHLQHIEKHKFQIIIEHLLERNMDKLCAVCLDSKPKLADMEDLVCLHGGFPEMMGERTLYSIIGSTVPDKSSYKYQELLIPNYAKVLSILKENKDVKSLYFALSSPIVLSKDDTHFDDVYLFVFSSPSNVENNSIKVNDSAIEAFKTNELKQNDNDLHLQPIDDRKKIHDNELLELTDNYVNTHDAHNKLTYYFSKPEYVVKQINLNVKLIKQNCEIESKYKSAHPNIDMVIKNTKPCNVCWIFKKPTCRNCVLGNGSTDIEQPGNNRAEETITISAQCSFCWVFINCPRCDHCKKEIKESITKSDSDFNKKIESGLNIEDENAVNVYSTNNKRKLTNDVKFTVKRAKWQCQICLTVNSNRKLCVCCDAQRNLHEGLRKIKFNFNPNFFASLNINNDDLFIDKAKDTDMIKETQNTDEVVHANITQQFESQIDFAEIPINSIDANENVCNLLENKVEATNTNENEEMDIVEEENNFSIVPLSQPVKATSMCDWTSNKMEFANQITTFQFNIGASATEDKKSSRRLRRPLRRSATSSHK